MVLKRNSEFTSRSDGSWESPVGMVTAAKSVREFKASCALSPLYSPTNNPEDI